MRSDLAVAVAMMVASGVASAPAQTLPGGRALRVPANPILADGDYYTTDPAPFVADGQLWILAGRDVADPDVNDFIMPEWQLLRTTDPAGGRWTHFPSTIRPEAVFAWAEQGRAYAGQIVHGRDGRYYFYAPVVERDSPAEDRFAIGVAVADSPLGPWRDAHPAGPIISQRVPTANHIQNIDPTVLVDDDGRVFLYWGTFGQLRGIELAADMITPVGAAVTVSSLNGFFEAPWIMKRKGVYYMLYAGNQAGPKSDCTPTVYHACIAYGTATSPLGPWTYRGVVLKPVSSTTSHAGAVAFDGQWYLAYHTADARGGGHFRRSVAIDRIEWDDSNVPARILPVIPTRRPQAAPRPARNIARSAWATASNEPVPVQYWIKALNDGKVRTNPLPPEMWGSWTPVNPAQQWIEYRWDQPVAINEARVAFWNDQPAGTGVGVAPPAAWRLQYWKNGWHDIPRTVRSGPIASGGFASVRFPTVSSRCVRLVMDASGDGRGYAGLAVMEWEILAPRSRPVLVRPDNAAPPAACG